MGAIEFAAYPIDYIVLFDFASDQLPPELLAECPDFLGR